MHDFFFGMLPWAFKLGNIYNIELELVHLMVMTSLTALCGHTKLSPIGGGPSGRKMELYGGRL